MSHVDEGELTAYADGAYAPDDPVAVRIATHLAECVNCRNRLAQAQALSMRAAEVLDVATPIGVQPPPFEQIARVSQRRTRAAAIPLAWAATVILALGIGWFGRASFTPVATIQAPPAPVVAAAPAVADVSSATQDTAPVIVAESRRQTQPTAAAPTIRAREIDAPVAAPLSLEVAAAEIAAPAPPPAAPPSPAAERAEGVALERRAAQDMRARAGAVGAAASAANQIVLYRMIPDLEIVSMRTVGDTAHVQQRLPDGVVITVTSQVQLPTERRDAAKALRAETSFADVGARGFLTVTGPLPADSLRALLQKVR